MTQYFPRQYGRFDGNVTVELDFSNYVTKADLKEQQGLIHLI